MEGGGFILLFRTLKWMLTSLLDFAFVVRSLCELLEALLAEAKRVK